MKWAQNPAKLQRAIQKLPKDATELDLLAEYRRIGGLVVESEVPNTDEKKTVKAKAVDAASTPVSPIQHTTSVFSK